MNDGFIEKKENIITNEFKPEQTIIPIKKKPAAPPEAETVEVMAREIGPAEAAAAAKKEERHIFAKVDKYVHRCDDNGGVESYCTPAGAWHMDLPGRNPPIVFCPLCGMELPMMNEREILTFKLEEVK